MRYLISPDKKLCLFWTPKCGCSTAVEIFFKYIDYDYSKFEWIHDARKIYQQTQLTEIPPEAIKIQIVRNPYNRAISSFLYYFYRRYKEFDSKILKEKIQKWSETYHVYNNQKITRLAFEFFIFISFFNHPMFASKRLDKQLFEELIFHSQRQFQIESLDFIIKLENLESDLILFNNEFNFSLQPANYSEHSFKKEFGEELYNLFFQQIFSFQSNIDNVKYVYKKDFQFFNYNIEININNII
jgi:hypothetical protein